MIKKLLLAPLLVAPLLLASCTNSPYIIINDPAKVQEYVEILEESTADIQHFNISMELDITALSGIAKPISYVGTMKATDGIKNEDGTVTDRKFKALITNDLAEEGANDVILESFHDGNDLYTKQHEIKVLDEVLLQEEDIVKTEGATLDFVDEFIGNKFNVIDQFGIDLSNVDDIRFLETATNETILVKVGMDEITSMLELAGIEEALPIAELGLEKIYAGAIIDDESSVVGLAVYAEGAVQGVAIQAQLVMNFIDEAVTDVTSNLPTEFANQ